VRPTSHLDRGYCRPVDVQVNTALNDSEHDQLDAWIRTRRKDEIDYVTIESGSVAIHMKGPRRAVMSAIAVRYAGLAAALDDALATLHNTP
jgi:hypothetical protein